MKNSAWPQGIGNATGSAYQRGGGMAKRCAADHETTLTLPNRLQGPWFGPGGLNAEAGVGRLGWLQETTDGQEASDEGVRWAVLAGTSRSHDS